MIDEKKLIEELQILANKESKKCEEAAEANLADVAATYNHGEICYQNAVETVNSQPKIGGWIPCSERMPEEHDSMFAKFKGTDKWRRGMFEKTSDDVNVTVEFEDGKRKTRTSYTIDGEWDKFASAVNFKVIAWRPLPEPYHE